MVGNTYYLEMIMRTSTLTQKGQATIPVEIRDKLRLHPGDKVGFEIINEQVVIRKINPFDYAYHKALSATLAEWDSKEDDDEFNNL
jgi:antitoxin PrlF